MALAVIVWCIFFLIVLFSVYIAPKIRRFKELCDFAKHVPGPTTAEVRAMLKSGSKFDLLTECRRKYGPVVRIWLGFELTVIFFDADDIKDIANSPNMIDKAKHYHLSRDWVGNGLVTNSGNHWRLKRKLLSPAFSFQMVNAFREPMEKCTTILIERLSAIADGQPHDIQEYPLLLSMDVICETAMGIRVNAQLNAGSEYVKANKLMSKLLFRQIFTYWKRVPFLYQFSEDYVQRKHALTVMHGESKSVIKMKRDRMKAEEEIIKKLNNLSDEPVLGVKRRFAFLDFLLKLQRESECLTDADIQEEVNTFMFAGQDTTGTGIGFCIYLLARHAEAQRTAFEEVQYVEQFDQNLSLPYLEAAIKETLRMYPSIPSFSRKTNEATKIGKYIIPANVTVTIPSLHVHREEKYFPDPYSFRPERFLSAGSADLMNPYANVTFGVGVRNCIGQRFAMMELKLVMARLLQAFEFSVVDGFQVNIVPDLTMKSGNGIWVRLQKRLQNRSSG